MSWKDPTTRRDIAYLLLTIVPPGYTITYNALAQLLGTSPRAVGAYMRANRDLTVVPCHRVVAKRRLGGFSKGIDFKKKLLKIEGALDGKARPRNVIDSPSEFWQVAEKHGRGIEVDLDDP